MILEGEIENSTSDSTLKGSEGCLGSEEDKKEALIGEIRDLLGNQTKVTLVGEFLVKVPKILGGEEKPVSPE